MVFQYSRPQEVRNYRKQVEFIDEPCRYTVVEATTKAGKTTGCIVWLFEEALKGKNGQHCWWIAPIFSQTEIAFIRMKRYITAKEYFKFNETKMTIETPNGVTIHFKSGDNPDSLYGEDVIACVIDEGTRVKEESWFAIRSTLTFTKGRVKIIGNVKGTMNWVYELARKAEKGLMPDWKYYRITADDAVQAGILEQAEIDDARATLPTGVFLELYYAIPNQNSSDKFCYAFDEKKHIGKCNTTKQYPLYLSFDFNRNPICCSVIQHYGGKIYVPETIKLPNSNIYKLCQYIRNKYNNHLFIVTGDATGKASNAMVQDNMNYFVIIRKELNLSQNQLKVGSVNPIIEDNQVLVNAILEHYPTVMDADGAAALIYDCKFVEMDASGKIKKGDREDTKQQADALDTFRYYLNSFHKTFIKI